MESLAQASDARAQPPSLAAGIALDSALRTSRRCTPNFRDTSRIVPQSVFVLPPDLFVKSTLALCSPIRPSLRAYTPESRYTLVGLQVGPIQTRERGQFQSSELTWQPTIDISSDVHEVRAHQANPFRVSLRIPRNGIQTNS